MKKLFWLLLATSLLALFVAQSHYNHRCMVLGAQAANITVDGVMCWYDLNGFRKFATLQDLQSAHDEKIRMQACAKENPENLVVCQPGYNPPIPEFQIGNG